MKLQQILFLLAIIFSSTKTEYHCYLKPPIESVPFENEKFSSLALYTQQAHNERELAMSCEGGYGRIAEQRSFSSNLKPSYSGCTFIVTFPDATHEINLVGQEKLLQQYQLWQTTYQKSANTRELAGDNAKNDAEVMARTTARLKSFSDSFSTELLKGRYEVDEQTCNTLRACGFEPDHFACCFGTVVQHKLQKELIDIVTKNADLYHLNLPDQTSVRSGCKTIFEFAHLGVEANWKGDIALGFNIADFCWHMLTCVTEIADGIRQGIIDAVIETSSDIYDRPFRTTGEIFYSKIVLAYDILTGAPQLLSGCLNCGNLYLQSQLGDITAQNELNQILLPIHALIQSARHAWWTLSLTQIKEICRFATNSGMQFYLRKKTLNAVSAFCKTAEKEIFQAIKKGYTAKQIQAIACPGGPLLYFESDAKGTFFKKKSLNTKRSLPQTPTISASIAPTVNFDIKKFGGERKHYIFSGKKVAAYKDPETNLWWSKDLAGHGGSSYKVFRKIDNKSLEWIYDADEMGLRIPNKHKSNVGRLVKLIG